MIPKVISPSVRSNAEKKIFQLIKTSPSTKDWVVLHSLGIEHHSKVIRGEIDFLILVPDYGMFCLEVKGGRIQRKDGTWYYTNKKNEVFSKTRGPFDQAKEGLYEIVRYLRNNKSFPYLGSVLHNYGVMFPDTIFENNDIEIDDVMIYDIETHKDIEKYIKNLSRYTLRRFKDVHKKYILPTKEDVKKIANLLRRNFETAIPLQKRIQYEEDRITELTEEQYIVLDSMAENPRCIVQGSAGTGKTVLILHFLEYYIENTSEVGFFCYNLLLAKEINHYLRKKDIEVKTATSFTDFIEKYVRMHKKITIKNGDKTDFYRNVLPTLALEVLETHPIKFETIIIDEAQDLFFQNYIKVIDKLLDGGLYEGNWYFFGDFSYQTIYNKSLNYLELQDYIGDFASYSKFLLTRNCRNSIPINKEMKKLIDDGKNSTILNNSKISPKVSYLEYRNNDEQKKMIESELNRLLNQGVLKSQITLLSPNKFEDSVVSILDNYDIQEFSHHSENITFSTIQGFKGLENIAIIITDIKHMNDKSLMYIAISRAKVILTILKKIYK